MASRSQITLDPEMERRAKSRASRMGLSFAEYVRRLIAADLSPGPGPTGLENLIGIGDSAGSDIRHREDEYLDAAFSAE